MSYDDVAHFAETWGLIFLILLFAIAVGYALWPGNREKFRRAARLPLEDDAQRPTDQQASRRDGRRGQR